MAVCCKVRTYLALALYLFESNRPIESISNSVPLDQVKSNSASTTSTTAGYKTSTWPVLDESGTPRRDHEHQFEHANAT